MHLCFSWCFYKLLLKTVYLIGYRIRPTTLYTYIHIHISNFVTYLTFIIFPTFCHLLTLYSYLFYTSHTQLSSLSYRTHALCANTLSELNRRLWPSCHSDMGESRHGWGFILEQTDVLDAISSLLPSSIFSVKGASK